MLNYMIFFFSEKEHLTVTDELQIQKIFKRKILTAKVNETLIGIMD